MFLEFNFRGSYHLKMMSGFHHHSHERSGLHEFLIVGFALLPSFRGPYQSRNFTVIISCFLTGAIAVSFLFKTAHCFPHPLDIIEGFAHTTLHRLALSIIFIGIGTGSSMRVIRLTFLVPVAHNIPRFRKWKGTLIFTAAARRCFQANNEK